MRTDGGVSEYRLLSKLREHVGHVKADSEPVVPERREAQSVSILVARAASAKGAHVAGKERRIKREPISKV